MKIGDKQVVHTATLLLPAGEEAWLDFAAEDWRVNINVVLLRDDDPSPSQKSEISVDAIDDAARLTFKNWNNVLGTALTTPLEIGRTKTGGRLLLLAWHTKVGEMDRLDLQFMLEAPK